MGSGKLQDWMQIVGLFSLVGSLIFVGLQMKQSHEIALANQYQARAAATQDMFMSMQESGINMGVLEKPIDELSPLEAAAKYNRTSWTWIQYDNHFYQYNAGFLDEESWQGLSTRMRVAYNRCDMRYVWESARKYYRPSFVRYIESLDDACEASN
jgi:hypothetical protein